MQHEKWHQQQTSSQKKHIHSKYCYKNGSHLIECQFRAFEFHKSGTETEPFYKISKQPSPSELSNPRFIIQRTDRNSECMTAYGCGQ